MDVGEYYSHLNQCWFGALFNSKINLMNRDISACNGIITKGGKCTTTHNCKRFELHKQKNLNQVYLPVPFKAVNDGVCSFMKEMETTNFKLFKIVNYGKENHQYKIKLSAKLENRMEGI